MHGREEVFVVSVEEFHRMKGQPTGELLVKMLRDSPLRDITIERVRTPARTRPVKL